MTLHLPARSQNKSQDEHGQGCECLPSLIPASYSNEGSTLDLVRSSEQYGLRLWEWEVVEVDGYVEKMGTAADIGFSMDEVKSPTVYDNEASRLRLPSYIGIGSTMVSIQGCDPCDESSILSQSPLQLFSIEALASHNKSAAPETGRATLGGITPNTSLPDDCYISAVGSGAGGALV